MQRIRIRVHVKLLRETIHKALISKGMFKKTECDSVSA
jgi:hypothetical protein